MPLDHYIPQVHLKNFYDPELSERMHGIRKRDLQTYHCNAYSQCRVLNGSTNDFLLTDRAIEDFLKIVEPRYNSAVAGFRRGHRQKNDIFVIAGFIAYIQACSPAAMRLHSDWLRESVQSTAEHMDALGKFSVPPKSLGAESLTELLQSGKVVLDVDAKYPQAMGIANIMKLVDSFGNQDWEILYNTHPDMPFVTSDYPVGVELTSDPSIVSRVIPLAPDIAVRIHPNFRYEKPHRDTPPKLDFSLFRFRISKLSRKAVKKVNQTLIRAAETTVYSTHFSKGLLRFVEKNCHYRTETTVSKIPMDDGTMHIVQQRIKAQKI